MSKLSTLFEPIMINVWMPFLKGMPFDVFRLRRNRMVLVEVI